MIHTVVPEIVTALNEFIRNELNLQEDMVVLTNPVDLKGNLNPQIDNKLCVFLQHLEEERVIKNGPNQSSAGMNPPMHFSLYIMFVANFTDPNYIEGLRQISLVLEFFQGSRVFDRSNMPMLSANVDKISVDYVNLDFKALNNIWGTMGLKYMPSAIFKIKLLSFTNSLIRENVRSIIGNSSQKENFNFKGLEKGKDIATNVSARPTDVGRQFRANSTQRDEFNSGNLDKDSDMGKDLRPNDYDIQNDGGMQE